MHERVHVVIIYVHALVTIYLYIYIYIYYIYIYIYIYIYNILYMRCAARSHERLCLWSAESAEQAPHACLAIGLVRTGPDIS